MRSLFYILLIYILYRIIRFLVKFLSGSYKKDQYLNHDIHMPKTNNQNTKPKHKDIEEADFREIKDDDDKG